VIGVAVEQVWGENGARSGLPDHLYHPRAGTPSPLDVAVRQADRQSPAKAKGLRRRGPLLLTPAVAAPAGALPVREINDSHSQSPLRGKRQRATAANLGIVGMG
jgi:hypothetical protein